MRNLNRSMELESYSNNKKAGDSKSVLSCSAKNIKSKIMKEVKLKMAENMYDSTWQELNDSFDNESGPRVPFMKLQPGKNVIRVASNPSKIYQHWEKTFDGKLRKITCIGKDCPLCAIGHAPSARYQLKVLDKLDPEDPQAKVLETGAAVIRQISNYANDEDYGNRATCLSA